MGIHDRDYMKRRRGDEPEGDEPAADRMEAFLSSFLRRNPRFFLFLTIGLGVLILIGLWVAGVFRTST